MDGFKNGGNLILEFKTSYSSPKSTSINLEFNTNFNPNGVRSVGIGNALTVGNHSISLKQQFIKPASSNFSVFGSTKVEIDNLKIRPIGIDSTIQVGTPQYVSWRRFILPNGIDAPVGTMVSRVRLLGGYNAPNAYNINLNWFNESYNPPNASNLNIDFGQLGYNNIFASLGVQSRFGTARIDQQRNVLPIGFVATRFGTAQLQTNKGGLQPYSWNSNTFGQPSLNNNARNYQLTGFVVTLFGTAKIELFKRFLVVKSINDYVVSDKAFVGGGKRFLLPTGKDVLEFGKTVVVNSRAAQTVVVKGINDSAVSVPKVYPLIIFQKSLIATQFGNAIVQFPPRPLGFVATHYGTAWISHSPRYLTPLSVSTFLSGYPKVFDPTQKIYVTGANTVITGGVFGDISARNTRRIIEASGLYSQAFSDWGVVESTRRTIEVKGFDSRSFGITDIYNKTPSIAPIGIYSFAGLNSAIGYRIRTIKPSGFYQPKLGKHTLTKTPELKPSGFNQSTFGSTWISHKTRFLNAGLGRESLIFGEINVWHFTRYLKPTGILNDEYGTPRVEHGRRVLLAKGSIHSVYGDSTWISYALRFIAPLHIDYPKIPNHRVGGAQHIQPFGYVATLFGSRIIPESQFIHTQGFLNPFGMPAIDLWKKYVKPNGFLTTGQEGGHRFGTHKFWNLRQYIEMYYDVDSGLTPPKWTGWTSIENKNKTIGAIGSDTARIGEPDIENKARLLRQIGLSASTFGKLMIADRVRHLKLQGMEAPYISGWSAIYNAASVIAQKGLKSDTFGIGVILNTRRYFNRIGNFESLEMGKPIVADRIRTLKFEHSHTISPPYIPTPSVHLYTRYIEEVGRSDDHQAFGNPSLSIRWNIITPRWTMLDVYGTPAVKNLTPEVKQRGHNSEEFGYAFLRTQWRELLQQGSETVLWGRSEIAFRDRQFSVVGFTQWAIPTHKVTKTGVPPYYPQYIRLDAVEIDGEQNDGHGIPAINDQVPRVNIRTNRIFTRGFTSGTYGRPNLTSNGISIDRGFISYISGSHKIVAMLRQVVVKSFDHTDKVGVPRISPWTIWATESTPKQAAENHKESSGVFQPIGLHGEGVGVIFGNTNITLYSQTVSTISHFHNGDHSIVSGSNKVVLKNRKIDCGTYGFGGQRFGSILLSPCNFSVEQFDSEDTSSLGRASLTKVGGTYHIKPAGISITNFGKATWVSLYLQDVLVKGASYLQMGSKLNGDRPFMWQGLRVGELVKGNYGGFKTDVYGDTWVSHSVREVKSIGFDSFNSEYDYENFSKRMRVYKRSKVYPKIIVQNIGFDNLVTGVPNIKPAVHYIRPDGNADQYRKGAF